jgi:hypothetical protein
MVVRDRPDRVPAEGADLVGSSAGSLPEEPEGIPR